MLERSFGFVLLSACLVISNGQLSLPGLGGLSSLGNSLQSALGNAASNPLSALTGNSNPLSALTGSNPSSALGSNPLGDLGNAAQNFLGNMMGNGTGGFTDALQSALNDTRDLLTTLLQFKLALYQAKENYFNSMYNSTDFPDMNSFFPSTTPSSNQQNSGTANPSSALGSALSGALGGALGNNNPLGNLGGALTNGLGGLLG